MEYTKKDALYAAQLIYPEAKDAKELKSGYTHFTFEVKTETYPESVIVRFGNNSEDKFCLEKEIITMKLLQENGIQVPRVILYDKSKQKVPFEFAILSKIPGQDLSEIWKSLPKKEQSQIAYEMGKVLGKIHQIKFDTAGYITPKGLDALKFDLKKVGEPIKTNPIVKKVLSETLHDLGYLASTGYLTENQLKNIFNFVIKSKDLAYTSEKPSLIHGDFEYRNIRVKKINNRWAITGILDFELSSAHAREYDFIKLHRTDFLTIPHIRESLLNGYQKYQKIGDNFDEKVKYFRFGRDMGFAYVLLESGDKQTAEKVLKSIEERITKNPIL